MVGLLALNEWADELMGLVDQTGGEFDGREA